MSATVLHEMNDKLCSFSNRWQLDGDYIRCRKCKRPQITNYRASMFPHAETCRATAMEPHPWLTLMELLRPLYLPVAQSSEAQGDNGSPQPTGRGQMNEGKPHD